MNRCMNVSDIHIVNHNYHVARIYDMQARIIVIGSVINDPRVIMTVPLYETRGILEKLLNPVDRIVEAILPYLDDARRIYLWGVQDVISYCLMCASREHLDTRVVPDNIEFFLRFLPASSITFRGVVKSALYGKVNAFICGNVREHFGRLTYQLPPGTRLDNYYSFYNSPKLESISLNGVKDCITFISQPYYTDHNICVEIWARRVVEILHKAEIEYGLPVRIYYHPRDSIKFRSFMSRVGVLETHCIEGPCMGVFSTLLFQASLSGVEVRIVFDELSDLFEENYIEFVNWFSSRVGIDPTARKPLSITPDQFRSIVPHHLLFI